MRHCRSNKPRTVDTPYAGSWADQEQRRRAENRPLPCKPAALPCYRGITLYTFTRPAPQARE